MSRRQYVKPKPGKEREQIVEYGRQRVRGEVHMRRRGDADELEREFVDGGPPPVYGDSYGSGTFGGLGDAMSVECGGYGVAIYVPSPAEHKSHKRWHDYCSEHGYPAGELCGADSAPGSKYPPRPVSRGKGRWTKLSWSEIRADLQFAASGQMAMF